MFTLPISPTGTNWYRVIDMCDGSGGPNTFVTPGSETKIGPAGTSIAGAVDYSISDQQ